MKTTNFNVFFLLFLFILSFFLSVSNQTARWSLAPEETFGMSLFLLFVIFLGNSAISLIARSKITSRYHLASVLTMIVLILGGGAFAFILSFAKYAKNYDYRYYWMFGTLAIIYLAVITTYAHFKKYNSKRLIAQDS